MYNINTSPNKKQTKLLNFKSIRLLYVYYIKHFISNLNRKQIINPKDLMLFNLLIKLDYYKIKFVYYIFVLQWLKTTI